MGEKGVMIIVCLVEQVDEPFYLSLQKTLKLQHNWEVAIKKFSSDLSYLMKEIKLFNPDIVMIDLAKGKVNDVARIVKRINQTFNQKKIIIVTGDDSYESLGELIGIGVKGYLWKQTPPEELVREINLVDRGSPQIASELLKQIIPEMLPEMVVNHPENKPLKHLGSTLKNSPTLNAVKEVHPPNRNLPVNPVIKFPDKSTKKAGISPPKASVGMNWRSVLVLLVFTVGITGGIYLVRERMRQPLPQLNIAEQLKIISETKFTGKVQPANVYKITATSGSVVEEIYVKVGDFVEVGQPLLVLKNLEAEKSRAQVEQQRKALQQQQEIAREQQEISRIQQEMSRRQQEMSLRQQQMTLEQEKMTVEQKIAELEAKIARFQEQTLLLNQELAAAEERALLAERRSQQVPLRQRQDSVARSQAIYDRALSQYNRLNALYKEGAISQDSLEQAFTDLQVAKADLEVAGQAIAATAASDQAQRAKFQLEQEKLLSEQEQKLREMNAELAATRLQSAQLTEKQAMIQEQLANLPEILPLTWEIPEIDFPEIDIMETVKATTSGVVTELPVTIGDQLYNGNPLIKLANLQQLTVEIAVNARLVNAFHPGQPALIKVGMEPGAKEFQGKVFTINPLPSENLNHGITVKFENSQNSLLLGQVAIVQLLPENSANISRSQP